MFASTKPSKRSGFSPTPTKGTVCPCFTSYHSQAKGSEHFHWKIDLPQAEFKHITTRMNGTTLTVQSEHFHEERKELA